MDKKYKFLLFDLDNTLVDDDENRKYSFKQILLEKNGIATEDEIEKFIKLDNQFWADRAAGLIKDPYRFKNNDEKSKWVRAQRFIRYFKNITFEEAVEINDKYVEYLNKYIVPINGAQEIMKYLYENGYEIYIITNGPLKIVESKLNKINIKNYIKGTFTGEEAGHMKPHDVFFEKFFLKMNLREKSKMLIIGDELDKDILGAAKCGIDSCWFNMNGLKNDTELTPNFEIRELIELKRIL